jgi:hypothetical protein
MWFLPTPGDLAPSLWPLSKPNAAQKQLPGSAQGRDINKQAPAQACLCLYCKIVAIHLLAFYLFAIYLLAQTRTGCVSHLVTSLDQVHLRHNLNGTLVNLGGNGQGLRTQTQSSSSKGSSSTQEQQQVSIQLHFTSQKGRTQQDMSWAYCTSTPTVAEQC